MFYEHKRPVPFDVASNDTFEAWVREPGGRTLGEFAASERSTLPHAGVAVLNRALMREWSRE